MVQLVASKRVLLGEVRGVHGVRGDVLVKSYTAEPTKLVAYGALENQKGERLPKMRVVRQTERGIIGHFEGVDDRTQALTYKGTELWIARERLPPPKEDEFYHADLVGLSAVTPDGVTVGRVLGVANFGAGDLLEIVLEGSTATEFFPFTNAVVPHVDLAIGTLTLIKPVVSEDDEEIVEPPSQG